MLKLYIGPMFAGKTSSIIEDANKFSSGERLIVNHAIDDRYNLDHITSHDKVALPSSSYQTIADFIEKHKIALENNEVNAVFIDEGQFFVDLYEGVIKLLDIYKKNVFISGLDGDYQKKPFGDILKLIPHADDVIKLRAKCYKCGNPAPFTKRLISSDNQVLVGGKDTYQPSCRIHYI